VTIETTEQEPALAGGYRELLTIAIPMVLSSGTQSMMHVVDRVFMTWYSKEAVAAALPAGIVFWSILSLPFGIVTYSNTFVAQYDGAKKPDRVAASVWQAVFFSIACGLLLMPFGIFAESFFNFVGHEQEIRHLEAAYFSWLAYGSMFAILPAALSCFFSGRGHTGTVLWVNLSSVLVNVILDSAFIFGFGPIPRMGMEGAAIATNLANVYATVCYAVLIARPSIQARYDFASERRLDRGLLVDLFQFGGPSGLQMFLDVAGFTVFIVMIGWIGQQSLAATNIAFNLNTLAFTPVIGMGIAVSTLVGQRIGEGRPDVAEQSAIKGFVLAGSFMLVCGAIYVFAPHILLAPYAYHADRDQFAQISQTTIVLLRFVALYSFFDAMAIIFGSAIRAAGDTTFSMLVTFACAWGLLVLPTYLTWRILGPNLFWSWTWCAIYVSTLGFIFLFRFRGGRWKSMNVIHSTSTSERSIAQ